MMRRVLLAVFILGGTYAVALKPYSNASPLETLQNIRFALKRATPESAATNAEKTAVLEAAKEVKEDAQTALEENEAESRKVSAAAQPKPSGLSSSEASHVKSIADANVAEVLSEEQEKLMSDASAAAEEAAVEARVGEEVTNMKVKGPETVKAIMDAEKGHALVQQSERAGEESLAKLASSQRHSGMAAPGGGGTMLDTAISE